MCVSIEVSDKFAEGYNLVKKFIRDECVVSKKVRCHSSDFNAAFNRWSDENHHLVNLGSVRVNTIMNMLGYDLPKFIGIKPVALFEDGDYRFPTDREREELGVENIDMLIRHVHTREVKNVAEVAEVAEA